MNIVVETLLKILIVVLMASIIGYNRERKHQIAGVRTHVLVAIGALLSIVLPILTYTQYPILNSDPYRLSAQVISGIGFLGAGTIIKSGKYIKGLTTAASLWVTAIIAITIGAGYYALGISSFVVTFSFLAIYGKISIISTKKFEHKIITIKYDYTIENKETLLNYLNKVGISDKYETVLSQVKVNDRIETVTSIRIKYHKKKINIEELMEHLIMMDFIISIDFNSELAKL